MPLNGVRSDTDMEELAKRMSASEDRAYREFSDLFGPRFRSFFLTSGLGAWDAEDLAVSCVTDIALKVNKYKSTQGGSFEAWVFTLARHALIDWHRKHQDTVPLSEELADPLWDQLEPNMDVVLAVDDAVAQLSETDQTIIQLRDLGVEHTYAEIGKRLSMPPGTVRVRRLRALKRLEFILEKDPRIRKVLDRKKNHESKGAE